MIERGGIYWADLGAPVGSLPPKRRPVVVSADTYNASRLATVLVAVITSNTSLATMPGNVFMPAIVAGLPRDSVVNVTPLVTLEKTDLTDRAGTAPPSLMDESSERAGWQWACSPPLCPRAPDRGKPRTRALSGRSQRQLRAPCKAGAS